MSSPGARSMFTQLQVQQSLPRAHEITLFQQIRIIENPMITIFPVIIIMQLAIECSHGENPAQMSIPYVAHRANEEPWLGSAASARRLSTDFGRRPNNHAEYTETSMEAHLIVA